MYSIKNALAILGILICTASAHAQAPNWTVNPGAYQYSMTLTTFLTLEDNTLINEEDKVAAFVDGEIRGISNPIYVLSAGRHLAYLTIYANKDGEKVEFRIYNSTNGEIVDVDATLTFKVDEQYGNVFQAFSLAVPALNNEASVRNFYFTDTDSVSTIITDSTVNILLKSSVNLSNLNPEFILSDGANMYFNRALLESGTSMLDFSEPVSCAVLSEDESVLNNYLVSVSIQQTSKTGFFTTNVITANHDGQNDYWIVKDAFLYENYTFQIFDANGRIMHESIGYNNDWDGTHKGRKVDKGNYYYMITNEDTKEVKKGSILVIY